MPPITDTLDVWDWRYRVGFDLTLREKVRKHIQSLDSLQEQQTLESILEWGISFISLDALLAYPDREIIKRLISDPDTRERILHVPSCLAMYFERKIMASDASDELRQLLDQATSAPYRNLQRILFEATFGSELDVLLKVARLIPYVSPPPLVTVRGVELAGLVRRFTDHLKDIGGMEALLRQYPIPAFQTEVVDGETGYAEYWPTELAPEQQHDKLILYQSDALMDQDTLQSTLFHEIYPGHGMFYDVVKKNRPPFFDHGAITLIEGWATWCEWTYHESGYARHARSTRARFLDTFYVSEAEEAVSMIDKLRAEREALDSREEQLSLFFQYPGFAASYALGALWFERHLKRQDVGRFLEMITQRPVGDFFRAWSETGVTSSNAP